ncbi:cellular tumor antigen p53-like [Phymastichus coffea]|uniref:cellular tumor antigen p53-like n=1 Tax=Phymastichus coffea TaxID=108790 RepID=UPI00273A9BF8|nr:cellular tumor antigen p53-like [Phymastichus coffea]
MNTNRNSPLEIPPLISISCSVPNKCQEMQKKIVKGKRYLQGPEYEDDVTGPMDFRFKFNVDSANSNYVYSQKLQSVYLRMCYPLEIKFYWISTYEYLFLNSAMIYDEKCHVTIPVQRCLEHMCWPSSQNIGIDGHKFRHVFKISNPVNSSVSNYGADLSGILTTRTSLKPENVKVWLCYKFFCKSNCLTGANRRSIKMLFLLENLMGVVIAKRSLFVKICALPQRDRQRDEYRIQGSSRKRRAKKCKSQQQSSLTPFWLNSSSNEHHSNEEVYSLNIDILGEENYKSVLKYAYDVMAAQAIRTGNHELFKPHMDAALIKE